jgi:hypothetical protein
MKMRRIPLAIILLWCPILPLWSQAVSLEVELNTYYSYKGYLAVFTPAVKARLDIPVGNGFSFNGSADLRFGFRYFAEDLPMGFFPEFLVLKAGAGYSTTLSGLFLDLEADLDFNDLVTRSSFIPRISWRVPLTDWLSGGIGLGFDFHPGNMVFNALCVSFGLEGDLSRVLPFNMIVSYAGDIGVRLDDYTYKLFNPAPTGPEDLFIQSKELNPYLSRYGEALTLDFPIGGTVIRYQVGNGFFFHMRFPGGNPVLELSPEESLESLYFRLDLIIHL